MQTERPCAVAACLPLEDDAYDAVLEEAGFPVASVAHSANEALEQVKRCRPGLLLANAVLPGADGVELARRVCALPLCVYPYILLVRPAGLLLPWREDPGDLGAAVLEAPMTASGLSGALKALDRRAPALPASRERRLNALMDAMGVPAHPGRDMLMRAVALAWRDERRVHNLRDRIYPEAGRPLGKTAAQAERAIRHVIDAAWRTGEIDRQQAIFGDTIDARRGRPTCGEMIAQLADILRWEG